MNYTQDELLTLLSNMLTNKYYNDDVLDLKSLVNDLNHIEGKEIFKVEEVQELIDFHGFDRTNTSS